MTGFIRMAVATPKITLAQPLANAEALATLAEVAHERGASVVLAPELSVTGATCGDLFLTQSLLEQTQRAMVFLLEKIPDDVLLVCGVPLRVGEQLLDCAVVLKRGQCLGYVPRTSFAIKDTTRRCFSLPDTNTPIVTPEGIPLGADLLFEAQGLRFGIGFGVHPKVAAASRTQLLLCLDADPEGVGAAERRRLAIQTLSQETTCACLYATAGEGESSTDGIYSGHRLLVSEGKVLAEAQWECGLSLMDFAPEWVSARRMRSAQRTTTVAPSVRTVPIPFAPIESDATSAGLRANPFLPTDPDDLEARCREILTLQNYALERRFRHVHAKRLVLGLSGGLDSTLALVVCAQMCQRLQLPPETVLAVTMPGFGTSDRTYHNAVELARTLGAELREISIVPGVKQHFADIGHALDCHDVTYENAQARARTYLLMDIANQEGGLLVGTGDLSEIALGWSTYNGDHMSMYAVNCGVPKTLIRACLTTASKDFAAHTPAIATTLSTVLQDICDTPVSPELVPGVQHTESIVGSYELHDAFLWYFLRYGCTREQLAELAALLHGHVPEAERTRTLDIFCRRVISQQFKRSCSPDGVAIGGVALSPRGGWMLPSDATLTL